MHARMHTNLYTVTIIIIILNRTVWSRTGTRMHAETLSHQADSKPYHKPKH